MELSARSTPPATPPTSSTASRLAPTVHNAPHISLLHHNLLSSQLNPCTSNDSSRLKQHSFPSTSSLSLPPNLLITHCEQRYVPSFRRINSLLLPIRYPDSFYSHILSDPSVNDLTRVAVWQDDEPCGSNERIRTSVPANDTLTLNSTNDTTKQKSDDIATDAHAQLPRMPRSPLPPPPSSSSSSKPLCTSGRVIGGVRCRVESALRPPSTAFSQPRPAPQEPTLYIQTLTLLSPYRSLGIATALLSAVIDSAVHNHGVREVYAHVWEANEDALRWYRGRGFEIGQEVQEGYYTKLRPSGARIVRRHVAPR
ncbi:MAG: hypothetical protein M1837_000904 [Sclerophora amabilis]|nr:MAG: hypothetical protein M1837_000904 [Sclerophora amabilis]